MAIPVRYLEKAKSCFWYDILNEEINIEYFFAWKFVKRSSYSKKIMGKNVQASISVPDNFGHVRDKEKIPQS